MVGPTTVFQTEISEQLLDGSPLNQVQAFMLPPELIVITVVIPDFYFYPRHQVKKFT